MRPLLTFFTFIPASWTLTTSQLNDFTKQFVQHTHQVGQETLRLSTKGKRYNFTISPFEQEDRALLVRLYNKYTEENCMTFRKFARKFKQKANEWEMIKEGHQPATFDLHPPLRRRTARLKVSEEYGDLEKLSEGELMEILKSLEADEENEESSLEEEPDYQLFNFTGSQLGGRLQNSTLDGEGQEQQQEQQVKAEIHSHSHYYLVQAEDGSIMELPGLTNQPMEAVQEFFNNSLVGNPGGGPCQCPSSSSPSSSSSSSSSASSSSSSSLSPSSASSNGQGSNVPSYRPDPTFDTVRLTTTAPASSVPSSTITQTLLPPVSDPSNPSMSNKDPALPSSSGPTSRPSPAGPTPNPRNGVYTCGDSSSGVTTNFVNPTYPGFDSKTGSCSFKLRLHSDVCQVRVDFVDTSLLPPVEGECSLQKLSVRGSVWPLGVPGFCGVNSEQHFYIETLEDGKREIEFLVETSKSSDYKWGLWITQIFCDGTRTIQAPTGCFQYHFDTSGLMKSFNYEGGQYLNNQHYRICILASTDACQIEYTSEGEFMLEKWGNYKTVPYTRAGSTSTYCVQDYLSIPGASNSTSAPSSDRFCGGQLNSQHGARSSQPLVSRVRSRLATLELHTGTPAGRYYQEHHSPGFRLKFSQTTCAN